jgi:hypothetical protein
MILRRFPSHGVVCTAFLWIKKTKKKTKHHHHPECGRFINLLPNWAPVWLNGGRDEPPTDQELSDDVSRRAILAERVKAIRERDSKVNAAFGVIQAEKLTLQRVCNRHRA